MNRTLAIPLYPLLMMLCLQPMLAQEKKPPVSEETAQAPRSGNGPIQLQSVAGRQETRVKLSRLPDSAIHELLQQIRQKTSADKKVSFTYTSSTTNDVLAADIIADAQARGLYEPFGAVFDIMGSFGDAGTGAYPAAQSGIQTQALGRIEWESEHYHSGGKNHFEFSYGGKVGLYPQLVLENLSSASGSVAQPKARPMFQNAFQWTIGPRINIPMFSHGEASIFANLGQNYLVDQVTSFKEGDNTITATPVSNDVGRSATFSEVGFSAKILSSDLAQAHENKFDLLRPLFYVDAGIRRDARFKRAGELEAYNHPEARFFFRFLVNLTKITAYNDDVKSAAPASFRFGVDLERGLANQGVPTAIRFLVSVDLNLMNLFKPSPPKPR